MTGKDRQDVIRRARSLVVWEVVGYRPTMQELQMGNYGRMDVVEYASRVLFQMTHRCIAALLQAKSEARTIPNATNLFNLACSEFFNLDNGKIGRLAATKNRLLGRKEKPTAKDIEGAIRLLLEHGHGEEP